MQLLVNYLSEFPHLISVYQTTLEDSFQLANDYEETRSFVVFCGDKQHHRATFGLIKVEDISPMPNRMIDEKILCLLRSALSGSRQHEEAVVTLAGGDARRALELMKQVCF